MFTTPRRHPVAVLGVMLELDRYVVREVGVVLDLYRSYAASVHVSRKAEMAPPPLIRCVQPWIVDTIHTALDRIDDPYSSPGQRTGGSGRAAQVPVTTQPGPVQVATTAETAPSTAASACLTCLTCCRLPNTIKSCSCGGLGAASPCAHCTADCRRSCFCCCCQ